MNDSSLQFLQAAQAGDHDAAAGLVKLLHARIYAFLRRLSGSDSDAVELTQRAFCRAWTALPGFAGRSTVSSWLHGIAYRTYVDWLRAERRNVARTDEWWLAVPDDSKGPDRIASDLDASSTVYAAVERLETTLREAVHFHYYQELTIEETAGALEVSTSTVKYRIRQALVELQAAVVAAPAPAPRRDGVSLKPGSTPPSLPINRLSSPE